MTTTNLEELISQRNQLDEQINELRKQKYNAALESVRELVAEHGLTTEDIFAKKPEPAKVKAETAKIAPKYRDITTGATWSGRGLTPNWLKGKNKEDYLVEKSEPNPGETPPN